MDLLTAQIPISSGSAAAYAFLATVIKDGGAVENSVELLRMASSVMPNNASYALNLVHGLEICNDYPGAFTEAREFLARSPNMRVGKAGFSCAQVLEVLAPYASLQAAVESRYESSWELHWVEDSEGRSGSTPFCVEGFLRSFLLVYRDYH